MGHHTLVLVGCHLLVRVAADDEEDGREGELGLPQLQGVTVCKSDQILNILRKDF
jgi:hypothetical protein